MLWRWRARRAIRPMVREHEAALAAVERGSEEWLRWWRATGERELRCILMTAWDPIGVGDATEAWDEYEMYEAGVAHRLRDAPNRDEAVRSVAAYLDHVERDFIEESLSSGGSRANRRLAEALVAWHEWSFEKGGRPPHEWLPEGVSRRPSP